MKQFTQEHKNRLEVLILKFIFSAPGAWYNPYALLHTTNIASLQTIYNAILKQVRALEDMSTESWGSKDYEEKEIQKLNEQKELVFLIIGYKKNLELLQKRSDLIKEKKEELASLRESVMTPADRIAKAEKELQSLENVGAIVEVALSQANENIVGTL